MKEPTKQSKHETKSATRHEEDFSFELAPQLPPVPCLIDASTDRNLKPIEIVGARVHPALSLNVQFFFSGQAGTAVEVVRATGTPAIPCFDGINAAPKHLLTVRLPDPLYQDTTLTGRVVYEELYEEWDMRPAWFNDNKEAATGFYVAGSLLTTMGPLYVGSLKPKQAAACAATIEDLTSIPVADTEYLYLRESCADGRSLRHLRRRELTTPKPPAILKGSGFKYASHWWSVHRDQVYVMLLYDSLASACNWTNPDFCYLPTASIVSVEEIVCSERPAPDNIVLRVTYR